MKTEQGLASTPSLSKERLLRILGVTFGVAVGHRRNNRIGIPADSRERRAQLGNSGLIMAVWIVSGLYAFAGANTYAELGTMLRWTAGHTFMLVGHMVSSVDFLSAGAIGYFAPARWHIGSCINRIRRWTLLL